MFQLLDKFQYFVNPEYNLVITKCVKNFVSTHFKNDTEHKQ